MLIGVSNTQWMWTIHALLGFVALCMAYALVLRTKDKLRQCFWLLFWALVLYVVIHTFLIFNVFIPQSIDPMFVSGIAHIFFLLTLLFVLHQFLRLVGNRSNKNRGSP